MTDGILKIVPGLMGVALVGESLKMIPDEMKTVKPSKKTTLSFYGRPAKAQPFKVQKQTKPIIKGFANIAIGTALVGATAKMI
jgi:hypothetical protein